MAMIISPEPSSGVSPSATPVRPGIRVPDARFMGSHPAHILALGFGTGLSRVAPGTVGSLFAWLSYTALSPLLEMHMWAIVVIAGFGVGVWACGKTGRDLGASDHGCMVWDEIIAMWLILLFTPQTLVWQGFAFLLFRFFDIAKPPPIRRFERRFRNGFGVMADDLIAAFFVLLVLAATVRWLA